MAAETPTVPTAPDAPVAPTAAPRVRALDGRACAGKTARLVEEVAAALASGARPEEILVVSPSRDAAEELDRRLAVATRGASAGVRCRSARAVALEILARPEVVRRVGHGARVLLDVERSLLVADLRHAGADQRAVAAAYAQLAAAWAGRAGAPDPTDELAGTRAAIVAALAERRAYDARELAARAGEALAADAGLAATCGARLVLVDDAHMLTPASLRLARALAGASLLLAGDTTVRNDLFDEGARPTDYVALARAVGAEVEALDAPTPGPDAIAARRAYVVKSLTPHDEARVATVCALRAVEDPLPRPAWVPASGADDPRDDPEMLAREVCLVTADRAQARMLGHELAEAGVPHASCLDRQPIAGDPRHVQTATDLQSFALLGIVADAGDLASWRTWLALGRADAGCGAWAGLVAHARAAGVTVAQAIARLADADDPAGDAAREPFEGARLVARRAAQAMAVACKAGHKRGRVLIDEIDPREGTTFGQLVEPVTTETAGEFMARVNAQVVDRGFAHGGSLVHVGVPEAFVGQSLRVVVDLGLNEGKVPHADAACAADAADATGEARAANEVRTHRGLARRAVDRLVLSYAQRCTPREAEASGAHVRRTRRGPGGETVAVLAPSDFLADYGHDLPSTMSGQQFMACHLSFRA